jgi:hypothetical protein
MGQGGDRGKGPNKTGTQPTGRKKSPDPPSKKAGQAGPKKVEARTTKKSRDK